MESEGIYWLAWWAEADWVVRSVFILLLVMSVLSWSVMFYKAVLFHSLRRTERLISGKLGKGEADIGIRGDPPSRRLLNEARGYAGNSDGPADRAGLEARIAQAVREGRVDLEGGLTLLATIGNSAPFIGLFGTVWGIMHALQGLGGGGPLSMDMVAGPVSEALVATAAGLFVAVPAVIGYNLLLRALRRLSAVIEGNALAIVTLTLREET
ncbi:MAG: MotA/TolQ/ExbB proton channel family protein [Proteobacteria bacterium]|nr:MotA/TolQ/ExbB proton channel family protein [Pseudomonadota bacterium]